MPDPVRLHNTILKSVDCFRRTPGRTGRLIELADAEDVLVAGDLHGHVVNYRKLLDFADLPNHPRRHFVVQELIHGRQYYLDGSDQSHRLVDLVAATKCLYPTRFHYLLGNHEMAQWTERAIAKHDKDLNSLFRQGIEHAYGQHGDNIYESYKELFRAIPAAIRLPNRVFLAHTCPGLKRLADWTLRELEKDALRPEDISLGGGLHAAVWGRETTLATVQKYLKIVNADLLVSGHIHCDQGHAVPNPLQLILDCKDENGSACRMHCDLLLTEPELLAGIVKVATLR